MALHRTQILLEEEQYQKLKALAAEEGIPLSALVRRLLKDRVGVPRRRDRSDRLKQLAGIAASGGQDDDHDDVIYRKDWQT